MNFWREIEGPFFALAPMEDVTDTVFREIVMGISDPLVLQVIFTEFTSTDGLMDKRGYERVSERLIVNSSEKKLLQDLGIKLVAQIWGNNPEKFMQSARLISEMNLFDGIDINMGCPVKKVVKKDTCSALIKMPELAKEIIFATKEGTSLPVSVKTRIGFNSVVTEEWIATLLQTKPAAITVHGRTQKMQSDGLADWAEVKKAVELRNMINPETLMLGNGDILSHADGLEKAGYSGVEGLMVGRGVFHDPWIFNTNSKKPDIEERINRMVRHIALYKKTWEGKRPINQLKRFFKIYINGFPGAAEYRAKLMETKSFDELEQIVRGFNI